MTSTGLPELALAAVAVLAGCPGATSTALPDCVEPGAPGWDGAPILDFTHRTNAPLPEGLDPDLEVFRREIVAGVGAADLDGDGHVDLVLPNAGGPTRLLWGLGDGTFVSDSPPDEFSRPTVIDQSVSIADQDGDGRPDVLIVGFAHVRLLRNSGGREFADVTAEVGLLAKHGVGSGSAWSDIDGDGDLDLWVGGYMSEEGVAAPDALWVQDAGAFTDAWADTATARVAMHGVFSDMDNDGDPDLLVANDWGADLGYSQMFENVEGVLGAVDRWTDDIGPGQVEYAMGATLADLDGDGAEDLMMSDIGPLHVFQRAGVWDFIDVSVAWAPEAPTAPQWTSWSMVPVDPVGDGRPGFFVTYGPLGEPNSGRPYLAVQPDRLFARDPGDTPSYTEATGAFTPTTPDNTRGVAIADVNEDGVPDLVLGAVDGAPMLYVGRCTDQARLVVSLGGVADARTIGARVTVEAGGRTQTQELRASGQGSLSVSEASLFFGLGEAARIDALRVLWPDGTQQNIDVDCVGCRIDVSAP